MSNNNSPIFNWPENPNGEPLKLITTSAEETIPTAQYANIKIFASVTEFVDDAEEGINLNQNVVESGLNAKRQEILDELDKS